MEITDVQIKLIDSDHPGARLLAYASLVLDRSYKLNDLKIIQGDNRVFVAMPARRLSVRCEECRTVNLVRRPNSRCVRCQADLPEPKNPSGEARPLYVDIFHPLHREARAVIDAAVLHAYQLELDAHQVNE